MKIRSLKIFGYLITLVFLMVNFNPVQLSASNLPAAQVTTGSVAENSQTTAVTETNETASAQPLSAITPGILWEKFVNRYQTSAFKVKILVAVIAYLVLSLLLLFIFILTNRTIKTRRRAQAQKIKLIYQEELTNFLFGGDNQVFEFTGINNAFNREIFINELLSLHNNLFGEAARRLRDLYFNLELYKDSLRKIDRRKWAIKAKGFRELAQMDVKDAGQQIEKYVNSGNNILRIESQLAMVRLREDDPLFFFDNLKVELSEWEQINILDVLLYHKINIESFERWMKSPNDSVVIFATKMAGFFKHIQSWPKVLELLDHTNPDVRLEALKTLNMFEISENKTPFIQTYLKEQRLEEKNDDVFYNLNMDRNRLAAIEALGTVATAEELPFFEKVLLTEKDFRILKKTAELISNISPGGAESLDRVYAKSTPELRRIIENQKLIAAS